MILPGGPMRVFVATKPVDFRKGIDGLKAPGPKAVAAFQRAMFGRRSEKLDADQPAFHPRARAYLTNWDFAPEIDPTEFTYVPEADAERMAWPKIADIPAHSGTE